jgi:flagellin
MLSVNTNVMSLNAQRSLSANSSSLATALARLSSGLRVNSAKDDAAGIAIAARMTGQVRGNEVAIRNAMDGVSVAQVAEGALVEVTNMLHRIRELAVQSASGQFSDTPDRANLDAEVQELIAEIDRIGGNTYFSDSSVLLLDGSYSADFQIGANSGNTVTLDLTSINVVGVVTGDVGTAATADTLIGAVDTALDTINTARATLGAVQSRFESIAANAQVAVENLSAARGRILDADFGKETAALTRGQILQQAGVAMLAQANAAPQYVLALLQ